MSYKHITRNRIAYFNTCTKAGKTDIVVAFDEGDGYTFEALQPETAHLLVDLLRNESPIWADPAAGIRAVADEPVGSGE